MSVLVYTFLGGSILCDLRKLRVYLQIKFESNPHHSSLCLYCYCHPILHTAPAESKDGRDDSKWDIYHSWNKRKT